METRKWYKGLIVEAADMNDELGPDGTIETAIDNLQYDYAIDGIISGLVATEHGTPDMTVDVSTGVAYDGDGKRCKVSSGQNVDLSGVSLPASGNEKYVSIYIENAKSTSEATIDDDGTADYWIYADSFLISFAEGAEAATGTATQPSLHATKRLIVDVLLYYGQTSILNADLDTTRRETAEWPADRSSVDASGWTELSTDDATVQDALDEIDGKLISRDGSGDIDQDLLPDGTADLGSSSKPWVEAYASKYYINTSGGGPILSFTSAQSISRYANLAAGSVYDTDNWTYTDATGVQIWESVAAAARQYIAIPVNLPNGATITDFDVQWYQSSSTTNNMTITFVKSDNVGAKSSIGGLTTPGGFGSYQTDNANITDTVIDNSANHYFFEIASSDASAATCRVKNIKCNFTITALADQFGW